jgi:hypothetical protein
MFWFYHISSPFCFAVRSFLTAALTNQVGVARVLEVKAITHYKALQMASVILGRSGPIIATAAVFVTKTAQGSSLSTAEVKEICIHCRTQL